MAEISKAYLEKKISDCKDQIIMLEGAIAAYKDMRDELFPPALSMDQLKQALGAAEIDEPQPV
jgi:hypothetical protein